MIIVNIFSYNTRDPVYAHVTEKFKMQNMNRLPFLQFRPNRFKSLRKHE
jgi:hypothetical protein